MARDSHRHAAVGMGYGPHLLSRGRRSRLESACAIESIAACSASLGAPLPSPPSVCAPATLREVDDEALVVPELLGRRLARDQRLRLAEAGRACGPGALGRGEARVVDLSAWLPRARRAARSARAAGALPRRPRHRQRLFEHAPRSVVATIMPAIVGPLADLLPLLLCEGLAGRHRSLRPRMLPAPPLFGGRRLLIGQAAAEEHRHEREEREQRYRRAQAVQARFRSLRRSPSVAASETPAF